MKSGLYSEQVRQYIVRSQKNVYGAQNKFFISVMRYFFHRLPEHRPANSTTTTPPPFPKKREERKGKLRYKCVHVFTKRVYI